MSAQLQNAKAISSSIEIPGRKMEFDFDVDDIPKYWYGNDAFLADRIPNGSLSARGGAKCRDRYAVPQC